MEGCVVLFNPRIQLFACTHPSVSNTFDCNALSVYKHQSTALCSNTFGLGFLVWVQASVSSPVFQTRLDCGSLSVYIISLQPFFSNTFDYGFLFVYPPTHTKTKVTPDWRRFFIKPELQISCPSSWRKSNYLEWMMWHWYARKRSMSHEKLSFIVVGTASPIA